LNINVDEQKQILDDFFGVNGDIVYDINGIKYHNTIEGEKFVVRIIVHIDDIMENYQSHYGEFEKQYVTFNDYFSSISIKKPNYIDLIKESYYINEFSLDNYKLPQVKELKYSMRFGDSIRISKNGISCFDDIFTHYRDEIPINLISNYEGLKTIFVDKRLNIKPSDKGKRAVNFLKLLENDYELRILSGENVIDIIKSLNPFKTDEFGTTTKKTQDKVSATYNDIRIMLKDRKLSYVSQEYVMKIIDWMVKRKLMSIGSILKCPECFNEKWYKFNDIKDEMHCEGCFNTLRLPLSDYNHLQYRYVINDLLGTSIEQGFLAHLLTYHYFKYQDNKENEFTLGYPGLEVFDGESCIAEIDLMMVISGKISLVECKTGRDIQENDIDKMVTVADRIYADVLIFCTLDVFSTESLELIREKTKDLHYKVLVLNKDDLLNQSYGRSWRTRVRGTPKTFHQLFVEDTSRML
jgi:hypothetical protein